MEIYKDLIGKIETALDEYQNEKYGKVELDDETSQEIFNECKRFLEHIKEDIEDLDSTIDEYIEDMNESHEYEDMVDRDYWERNEELRADSIIKYGR